MVRSARQPVPPEGKTKRRSQRLRSKQIDPGDDSSIILGLEEDNTSSRIEQEGRILSDPSDINGDLVVKDTPTQHLHKVTDIDSVQYSDGDDGVDDGGTVHRVVERGVQGRLDSEDDSDGAPEDISLAESKLIAMETLKNEQDQVKKVHIDVKEKRRKKHELFRKQKVLKRSKVISRFPTEALEEVSMQMAKEKAAKKAKKKLKRKLNHKNEASNRPLPSEALVGPVKVVALSDTQEVMGGVLTNDFRQEHFYGNRLKRLPALSIQAKKYRNIPAKNFIKTH